MDVLLSDAKVREALASASSTSEWKSDADAPSIPDRDWHTVGVRVVVERYENGVTTESAALETTLRAAEVLDRPITLFHKPDPWPENLAEPAKDPNALGDAAVNVREWVPVLQVGDESWRNPDSRKAASSLPTHWVPDVTSQRRAVPASCPDSGKRWAATRRLPRA